jgi:hypothetical protein
MIAPATATPRAALTWRLVEVMAAATPAWLFGMPDNTGVILEF